MDTTSALIIAFTIVFSPFAAFIAYIITYDEYQHHMSFSRARKRSFQTAFFTFLVFIAVGLVSGFVFRLIARN